MADFLLRQMAEVFMQPLIAPIPTHGCMKQVLMYGRQLRLQDLIKKLNDAFFGFHDRRQLSFLICSAR